MRVAWILALLIAVAAPLPASAAPDPLPEGRFVVRIHYRDAAELRGLGEFDLLEYRDRAGKFALALVDRAEYARLQAMGHTVEVDEERTVELQRVPEALPGQTTGIPGYPCYRTVEETYATAQAIVAAHPDLANWSDVGDSWQRTQGLGGYDLMVLRLSNSAIAGHKPKLFVTASIHAREYTPAELVTRFAEQLVDGYGVDADATWLLDYHEIHLMLQANPDGRKQAETGLSWRKNTNENYCGPTSTSRGADLNRNFEYEWGCCGGSSGSECATTYRGPAPASEPETQAVQDYLRAQFPDVRGEGNEAAAPLDASGIYLDIHSSGQLVLWPWGFGGDTGNDVQFQTLGRKLAYLNGYFPEQAFDFYVTDGVTLDFGYGELGVASVVFELGTSFFQNCSTFEGTVLPDNLPALLYAAKAAAAPYRAPAGPEALDVAVAPGSAQPGTPLSLTALLDDTRFSTSNGSEPTQPIVAAEFYVDTPPWVAGAAPQAMTSDDGGFDESVESASGLIDTTGLPDGRHIVFVRALDADGNWGVVGAAFFDMVDGPTGTVSGRVTALADGSALAATVGVPSIGVAAATDPVSGAYRLVLPVGTWTLRASAPGYFDGVAPGVVVGEESDTSRDFALEPAPAILLVDDDGDAPDVRGAYVAALDARGDAYSIWDTADTAEPAAEDLGPYSTVLWFSGGRDDAAAGPGPAAESALAEWLAGSGCLWIGGQDYLASRGRTDFMEDWLGLAGGTDDVGQTSVQGIGAVFGGLGPFTLAFPYADGTDLLVAGGPAKVGFVGSAGDAAITRDGGFFRTSYLGFGLEAIPGSADRAATLGAFLDWCAALPSLDGDADGVPNAADCAPGDDTLWAAPSPARGLTLSAAGDAGWSGPLQPGAATVLYDLLRGATTADFAFAGCVAADLAAPGATDPEEPEPGGLFRYLVRVRNGCGRTLGTTSGGIPRAAPNCP